MANATGSVAITDGDGIKVVATDGLVTARSLILNFTTDSSGNCVWPFVDSVGNVLKLNAFLLTAQFKLGSASSFNAKLQIGIGAEDVFVGKGQSISGTTNNHPGVTITDGTNNGVGFPPIIGQPTLNVDTGGNVKTGSIQLMLKLVG